MKNTTQIQARKKERLTQRKAAQRPRITVTGCPCCEMGMKEPEVSVAQRTAYALNRTVDELLSVYRKDTTKWIPRELRVLAGRNDRGHHQRTKLPRCLDAHETRLCVLGTP